MRFVFMIFFLFVFFIKPVFELKRHFTSHQPSPLALSGRPLHWAAHTRPNRLLLLSETSDRPHVQGTTAAGAAHPRAALHSDGKDHSISSPPQISAVMCYQCPTFVQGCTETIFFTERVEYEHFQYFKVAAIAARGLWQTVPIKVNPLAVRSSTFVFCVVFVWQLIKIRAQEFSFFCEL